MNPELFQRLLIAIGLSGLGIAAYLLINRRLLAQADSKVRAFKTYQPGQRAIVYFTTPTCAPCKTVQRPALERLKKQLGERLQVIEVDASAQPELASQWGVLSVPTTFIFDPDGKPRYVNHGVTTAEKLYQQLEIEDYSI